MEEIRRIQEHEFDEAIKLADSIFRDSEQVSMGTAFPHVFSSILSQSYGAYEDGKLIAFMGLVPSVLRIGSARVSVYSLGAVCTDPTFRGQGHASRILVQIQEHIRLAGASLLLVTGTRDLYLRAGCCLFGNVSRYTMGREHVEAIRGKCDAEGYSYRELDAKDWHRITKTGEQREVRYEQSVWDLAGMIKSEAYASCLKLQHKVFVAEKEGAVEAYLVAAVPKGLVPRGLPFAVESIGNNEKAIAGLLAHTVESCELEKFNVPVSWHETELAKIMADVPNVDERNLGTVYVVDPTSLLEELRPYLIDRNAQIGDDLKAQALSDGKVKLMLSGLPDVIIEQGDFVSLLFDTDPIISLTDDWKQSCADLFPIPLPYTGGLNYV